MGRDKIFVAPTISVYGDVDWLVGDVETMPQDDLRPSVDTTRNTSQVNFKTDDGRDRR